MRRLRVLSLSICLVGIVLLVGTVSTASTGQYKGAISADKLEQMIDEERSDKVVLLNFWATWCSPCRREMPELAQLRRDFSPEELVILSVSLDYNSKVIPHFVDQFGLNFPVYRDGGGVAQQFEVAAVPKVMLFTQNGLVMEHAGYVPPAMLRRVVEQALDKQ